MRQVRRSSHKNKAAMSANRPLCVVLTSMARLYQEAGEDADNRYKAKPSRFQLWIGATDIEMTETTLSNVELTTVILVGLVAIYLFGKLSTCTSSTQADECLVAVTMPVKSQSDALAQVPAKLRLLDSADSLYRPQSDHVVVSVIETGQ